MMLRLLGTIGLLTLLTGTCWAWSEPDLVEIQGYTGPATEPGVSPDGNTLFWQNGVDPPSAADLHYANRVNGQWVYAGKVMGADVPNVLDGTPAMVTPNILSFVSMRELPPTMFWGIYLMGTVTPNPMPIPVQAPYYVIGGEFGADLITAVFALRSIQNQNFMDLRIATYINGVYVLDDRSMTRVNTADPEYAPEISKSGLVIYFTRAENNQARIMVATRPKKTRWFSYPSYHPTIPADWFVEGPTLTGDEMTMYFHRLEPNGTWRLYSVSR